MTMRAYRRDGRTSDPPGDVSDGLARNPLLYGRELSVELDGTGTAQKVRHGLGRIFRGAFVVGVGNTGVHVAVSSPQNVIDAGEDPTIYIRINPDATTVTTVTLWVY